MSHLSVLSLNTQSYLARYSTILARLASCAGCAEQTSSVSGAVIARMLPHLDAAVSMSRNFLRYTTNLELQRIAGNIIAMETRSIAALRRMARACAKFRSTPQSVRRYIRSAAELAGSALAAMENVTAVNSIERNFIEEMLLHHAAAIRMGRLALTYPLAPGLVPVLEDIIDGHARVFRELREARTEEGQ